MSKIGFGVVGAGSIGIRGALQHLTMADVADRVQVTAVCDPVPGRASAAAERFRVENSYQTLEELLADKNVDAITLGTPIGLHYQQGLQAIRAGKHIHFNKTMTMTTAEATHLIDEAAANRVKIVASPGQMIRPSNQQIRSLIQAGALGKLSWSVTGAAFGDYHEAESVRTGTDVLSNIDPSWYWRKPGGGPMYDMTVYGLHTMTGILGSAKRVTAMSGVGVKERAFQGKMVPCDADDNTFLLLDFGDNVFAFVYGSFAGGVPAGFHGEKGSIVGNLWNGKPIEFDGMDDPTRSDLGPHVTGPHIGVEEAHVFEDMMQLVDLVLFDRATVATPEHARHVIEIIEKGYLAAESGVAQNLKTTF